MQMVSDRNLLFGILALQMNFIDQQQLVSALQSWVKAKQKPLSQILIENGAMADAKRQLLEPLLDAFIQQHDGDAQQTLAALTSIDGIQQTMQSL